MYRKKPRIFRRELIKSGTTPAELAEKINVNTRTVERWYSGKLEVPRNESLYLKILSVINPKKAGFIEPALIAFNQKLAVERRHSEMTNLKNGFYFKEITA